MAGILFAALVSLLSACSDPDRDPDAARIEALTDEGVDAARNQALVFTFALPDAASARKLCRRLKAEGFVPQLDSSTESARHLCHGRRQFPLEVKLLRQLRQRFEVLAGNFNGDYLGWELDRAAGVD